VAADANNGGIDAQVRYLVEILGPEEAARVVGGLDAA
jgi:hypothetical protein